MRAQDRKVEGCKAREKTKKKEDNNLTVGEHKEKNGYLRKSLISRSWIRPLYPPLMSSPSLSCHLSSDLCVKEQ
jgi:hypothetical protein